MYIPYIGSVMYFALPFEPRGWSYCDGRSVPTSGRYNNLFKLIGYTYGGSGGSFNLPDLRGRALISTGLSYKPGAIGGHETTGIDPATNMPAHSHSVVAQIAASAAAVADLIPTGHFSTKIEIKDGQAFSPTAATGAFMGGLNVSVQTVGNGVPFNNLNPYQVIPVCIAYDGIYPGKS